jgi:3-(methylthio)propionyl---CoA ligase
MLGNMMQRPLLISSLLVHAERHHGSQEIVSKRVEGDIHRCTYRDLGGRARRLANALGELGVEPSDRVATLAWNGYRHMELYFAISGIGAVTHTINPRLHGDQIAWIASHSKAEVLFFDLTFVPLIESIASKLQFVKTFVLMTDRSNMPQTKIENLVCYEDLLKSATPKSEWPTFDENEASALCYTSGTTGNPKGVLYSHRSTVLHAFALALPDALKLSANDTILPIVPMFHVNAWGLPYAACLVGAKLVYPGPNLDGKSVFELMEAEGVTRASAVPTVWLGLQNYLQESDQTFSTLRRVGIGGAACSPIIIREFLHRGVEVMHGWGMTETSPMATISTLTRKFADLDEDAQIAQQAKQGRILYGVDMKVVDANGKELPWDGKASGQLFVQGPWIVSKYYRATSDAHENGWFPTGDIATIDADGYMQITDRSKDVIKSGGEWISSTDLENIASGYPGVAMAACVAAPHPKWDERPVLFVVLKEGAKVTREDLLNFYTGKIAKWWTPDEVIFVGEIPIGATGKILKNKLREKLNELGIKLS